jgi:hypothetical protein
MILYLPMSAIAAPRLRPLFKDKQIVEGSDGYFSHKMGKIGPCIYGEF